MNCCRASSFLSLVGGAGAGSCLGPLTPDQLLAAGGGTPSGPASRTQAAPTRAPTGSPAFRGSWPSVATRQVGVRAETGNVLWLLVCILVSLFPFILICVRAYAILEVMQLYRGTLEISRKEQKKLRIASDPITAQHTSASVSLVCYHLLPRGSSPSAQPSAPLQSTEWVHSAPRRQGPLSAQ